MSNESGRDPRDRGLRRRNLLLSGTTLAAASALGTVAQLSTARAQAQPAGQRPNILVIFGDDIGLANISAYSHGLMGYQTPNIDRIAREGMMFIEGTGKALVCWTPYWNQYVMEMIRR